MLLFLKLKNNITKQKDRHTKQAQSEQIKDIFHQCATKPISYWSHLGQSCETMHGYSQTFGNVL